MATISRKFVVPAFAAGALVLAGTAYGVTKYRNIPGPVAGSYAGGITGAFRVQIDGAGIPSAPSGGACIITRARDLGYSKMDKIHCANDAQCTTSENPYGYCELPTHKCWAKPVGSDPKLCKKFPSTVATGVKIFIPVSHASLVGLKIPPTAKVRVLTCLNGIPGGGCGLNGAPYKHEWGDPKQLHP